MAAGRARGGANGALQRNPVLMHPDAVSAGQAEGWAEARRVLPRAVCAAVGAGSVPTAPDVPRFAAGRRANVPGGAIARSNRERGWVEVRT